MDRNEKRAIINSEPLLYTADLLTPTKEKYSYICPFCGSGTGVNGNYTAGFKLDRKTKRFKCFKCDRSEDAIGIIRHITGMSENAVFDKYIRDDFNPPLRMNAAAASGMDDTPDEDAADFTSYYKRCNLNINATTYHRGLSSDTLNHFLFGFDAAWKHPKRMHDKQSPRLIIPTSKSSYTARYTGEGDYINSQGHKMNKGKVGNTHIFNEKALKGFTDFVFIPEGEIDAASFYEIGFNACGLGGQNIRRMTAAVKRQKPAKSLVFIIVLDNDTSEQTAATVGNNADDLKAELNNLGYAAAVIKDFYDGHKDANEYLCSDKAGFTNKCKQVIEELRAAAQSSEHQSEGQAADDQSEGQTAAAQSMEQDRGKQKEMGYPDTSEKDYLITDKGGIKSCDYNYMLYLLKNSLLDEIYFDTFSQTFVKGTYHLNDDFFRNLYGDIVQTKFFTTSNEKQVTAMCKYLVKKYHSIHLAKLYFDGLKWDGKPRLDRILIDLYGVDDTVLAREALKMWMTAAVKRVYSETPVQFDYILLLKGEGGGYKTSFFNALGLHGTEGRYFCNSLEKQYINNPRAFALNMQGKLICYDGDVKVLKDTKSSDIKNFLTRTYDTFDNKFDTMQSTVNRQFVIAADSNENAILDDITGNRRYIILKVNDTKSGFIFHCSNWCKPVGDRFVSTGADGKPLTGEQLVNQMWAEAAAAYKANPDIRLDLSDEAKALQAGINEEYNDSGIEPFYDDIVDYALQLVKNEGTAPIKDIRAHFNGDGLLENFGGREQITIISKCLAKAGFCWKSRSVNGKKIKVFVPEGKTAN